MVKYCLQGYNATILAYGQTGENSINLRIIILLTLNLLGAGKTFTMGTAGSQGLPPDALGMIPRAIQTVRLFLKNRNGLSFYFIHRSFQSLVDLLVHINYEFPFLSCTMKKLEIC
jgi:hypothetical protein